MKRLLFVTLLTACTTEIRNEVVEVEIPRPPGAVDVTMEFCQLRPDWFAFQNEGYDWVIAVPFTGQSVFTFPASPRLTVVTGIAARQPGFTSSSVTVRYLTAGEAAAFRCSPSTFGQSTLSGAVETESDDDLTLIEIGGVTGFTQGSRSFTLEGLAHNTVLDLIALNRFVPTDGASLPPRVIVRNNVAVASDVLTPVLNFASAEARPLGAVRITRTDGGAPDVGFSQYESANKTRMPLVFLDAVSELDTLRLPVVPASLLKSGDLHRFDVQTTDRGLTYWQPLPRDTAITFGPALVDVALDTVSTTPVLRHRVRFASQAEYPAYAEAVFHQTTASAVRSVEVITSAAYLGGVPAQWELVMPDLRGVVPNGWMLSNTASVTFGVVARNARPELYNGLVTPAAGETMAWASRPVQ